MTIMKKIIFLILVAGLFALLFFTTTKNAKLKNNLPTAYSADILFLSPPVLSLSAKVDKISGNSVWVSQSYTYNSSSQFPPMIIPPLITTTPEQQSFKKEVVFELKVSKSTTFSQPPVFIPYPAPSTPPTIPFPPDQNPNQIQKTPVLSDLKIGDLITFTSNQDIRIAKDNKINVQSIQLPQITNSLSGTVIDISGNSIIVKGSYLNQIKNYTINTTAETKVMINSIKGEEEITFDKIKKEDIVTVYAKEDITALSTIPAVVIQVSSPPPLPPAIINLTPIASPEAK